MNADLRGFRYDLQPALNRQQWRVDALQARLAAALRAVVDARDAIERRERQLAEVHASLSGSEAVRLEPASRRRALQWLSAERIQISALRADLAHLEAKRAELQAECRGEEAKLESLHQHRSDSQGDYVLAQQRRDAAAADDDWIARRGTANGASA